MKEVKNCRKCNIVFLSNEGSELCKKCESDEEETYKTIRDFLYANPGISIHDLSEKLNISVRRIEHFIRKGRLNIS